MLTYLHLHMSDVTVTQPRSCFCYSWCFEVLDYYRECGLFGYGFVSGTLSHGLRGLMISSTARVCKPDFSSVEGGSADNYTHVIKLHSQVFGEH